MPGLPAPHGPARRPSGPGPEAHRTAGTTDSCPARHAMTRTSSPDDEAERLDALQMQLALDSVARMSYDDLTLLAAAVCAAPVALLSLLDGPQHSIKSCHGITAERFSADGSFGMPGILGARQMVEVPDAAADPRFADSPLVRAEPAIRFCAALPLTTDTDLTLGTLWILDYRPRRLEPRQRAALEALGRQAAAELKMRSIQQTLWQALEAAHRYQAQLEEYHHSLRKLNRQLHAQAIRDPLTGLYNRLALMQQLNQGVARAERRGEPLSLLLIDVDHFKSFNDGFGHLQGDEALRQIAEILRVTAREADSAARFGGEEFVLVLPATTAAGALALAERIRQEIELLSNDHRGLTVSIGTVTRHADHPRCTAQLLL